MPAGRVLGVIVIALGIAALFNSEAIVRAGEGMKPGTTRDIVLSIGRPLNDAVGAIGFHLPRDGLDLAFGHDPKTAGGTELEQGSTAILRRRLERPRAAVPEFRQPTPERPLDLLVTGDSEASFVGERLADQAPAELLEVETVARNGTGLTNPAFFNWELNARQEIESRDPDAVVMAIGGNDGFNMEAGGELYGPHDPEWQTEYARRVAVVMRELTQNGKRPVFWVPPPTARDDEFNAIYGAQNRAVEQAAEAVPGARYVDVYNTINGGKYSDELTIDGHRVLARQSDGVHFTREGAVVPTRILVRAMAKDYPAIGRRDGP